ncbi:DUF3060 domain-containing protein [Mycolicibacterium sp. BiH015]|uniref:DUF3060 domain-containing protein n=1 Tax=Mycolicibacterium sp. BiH015 TaxID=3018808 RepID=UPI0022E09505|nr:DUF3060 domain-containing protein [Mycolicibacterium sp. BiH015]MDA2892028.1 DUF3060 domain-containing protein [Mycolicibacterium sp. BiH015]
MEPYGDPEARIRDLERPLADRAQYNELGTQPYEAPPTPPSEPYQYVPPPPPPPPDPYQGQPYGQYGSQYGTPQYTSPYYSAPQQVVHKRSSTTALWLIPLVVGGIIVAGAVAIVLYFNTADPDTYSVDPTPPISGGGGPLDTPAPPVGIPPVAPEQQVITVEAGGSVSVSGFEKNETIVCNGGTVTVSGVENAVDIQGSCGMVTVSGTNNTVTVETAQTISASGFENRVTYRSGEPQVTNSGTDNIVEQG